MANTTFATAIYTALPYFLQLETVQYLNADKEAFKHEKDKLNKPHAHPYDFIIVGAGTAGCILANRLSVQYKVLLLESGGKPPFPVQVPALGVGTATSVTYMYHSTPQVNARNRSIPQPMARMLGGSYGHNAMVANRGHSLGYDLWANLTKDPSWKYSSVLKYFKKAERYAGKFPSDQHGTSGPLTVDTYEGYYVPFWLEAGKELGFTVIDPNGPQTVGIAAMEETVKAGRRQTTYSTYVEPILETRKNLKVVTYANVMKILFRQKHAYGVEYERHGTFLNVFASKEVILSAGVFGSPMLLFKSGIGPKKMLKRAGIRPIADLPVGKYMQDHHGVTVKPFLIKNKSLNPETLTPNSFEKYLRFEKEGVLSNIGDDAQGFFTSRLAHERKEADWPDLYLNRGPTGENEYGIVVQVTRPIFDKKSMGTIKLNHTAYRLGVQDDTKLAIIDIKIFQNPSFFRILQDGIRIALNLSNTKSLQKIGSELIPDSECAGSYGFKTDRYWDCYTRKTGYTFYHTVGTCRMGPGGSDKEYVVDSKLRVLGILGLRITDASVIPIIPNSNTNIPVIMIAEKSASMILKSYRQHRRKTKRTKKNVIVRPDF